MTHNVATPSDPSSGGGSDGTDDTAAANCGFACHVFVVLLGVLYVAWISSSSLLPGSETLLLVLERHPNWEITSFVPDKSWSVTGSATLVVAFFAAPVLYAVLNALSVPAADSMDGLTDQYARRPPSETCDSRGGGDPDDRLSEIYDLDVATINDMVLKNNR